MSTVLKNPLYFLLLALLGVGAYVTYSLNLWGPMLRMANAASAQAVEIAKEKLRGFVQETETGRQAMAMSGRAQQQDVELKPMKAKVEEHEDEDEDI